MSSPLSPVVAVIPALNEVTRIKAVVEQTLPFVDKVVVVDDGSTDGTGAVAAAAGAVVVRHAQNLGPGAATMTGIVAARRLGAKAAVTLDADGQHFGSDIPAFLGPLERGEADVAFANRFGRINNIPLVRRLANAVGNFITYLATGLWVADSQCGLKAFGPKALAGLNLRMPGFEFCTEIVREVGRKKWTFVEVPAKVVYSEYTMAKGQSFATGIKTAARILLRSFMR